MKRKARSRPPGYLADVRAHAHEWNETAGWYTLTDAAFDMLRRRWTPTIVSDWGNRYAGQLHDRLGGAPCGECEAERVRMNGLTWGQCRAERDTIIAGTVDRAKRSPRWWDRIRAKAADAVAHDWLIRQVSDAFDAAVPPVRPADAR